MGIRAEGESQVQRIVLEIIEPRGRASLIDGRKDMLNYIE